MKPGRRRIGAAADRVAEAEDARVADVRAVVAADGMTTAATRASLGSPAGRGLRQQVCPFDPSNRGMRQNCPSEVFYGGSKSLKF